MIKKMRIAPHRLKEDKNLSAIIKNKGLLSVNEHLSTRVSDPDPQDPHVFALPGSGQKGKEMNE